VTADPPAGLPKRAGDPLLEITGLVKHFPVRTAGAWAGHAQTLVAVDGVDLSVGAGESLGLVGETGCGKTTLGRLIVRLLPPTDGIIRFEGRDITRVRGGELKALRGKIQLTFQDPYASLNPLMTIGSLVEEPLRLHGVAGRRSRRDKAAELLQTVGLSEGVMSRRPVELSGGQRQRVGIARAIAVNPRLIVCDEPTSALDVSIRAQIVNLMKDLQEDRGLTYVFISHDLALVEHVADRVAVMYLGRIVELASRKALFAEPHHPYTESLLSANPLPDPEAERRRTRIVLAGDPPSPINRPGGCHFHPRCPIAQPVCAVESPALRAVGAGHLAACHFAAPHPVRAQKDKACTGTADRSGA
jgi:oligopeptide transport system ATP-binding protein